MGRRTVLLLTVTATLLMVGCGEDDGDPVPSATTSDPAPTGTQVTTSVTIDQACSDDERTLRTAEEAYFARNGRYGTMEALVSSGLLAPRSYRNAIELAEDGASYELRVVDPACGTVGEEPPTRQLPTSTTDAHVTEGDCTIDVRTLRTAEEAYFARYGRYADEPSLVSEGFLSQDSPLFDIEVAEDGSSLSIKVVDSACGTVGTTLFRMIATAAGASR